MSEGQVQPPDRAKKHKPKAVGTGDAGSPPDDDESQVDVETDSPVEAHGSSEPVAHESKRTETTTEEKTTVKKEKTGSAVPKPTAPEEHKAPSLPQRMRFRRPFKK